MGNKVIDIIGFAAAQNALCVQLTPKHFDIPDDSRVYALSDTHGHKEVMDSSLELITRDAKDHPVREGQRLCIVALGDLIDKGMNSRQVVDSFLSFRLPNHFIDRRPLAGNHEYDMVDFLNGPEGARGLNPGAQLANWMHFASGWIERGGGAATLRSYGAEIAGNLFQMNCKEREQSLHAAQDILKTKLKELGHFAYFKSLLTTASWRHVVFCHAQIYPDLDVKEHGVRDVIRGRDIVDYHGGFAGDKVVVYGHSGNDRHGRMSEQTICIDPVVLKYGTPLVLAFDNKRGRVLELEGTRPLDTSYVRRHSGPVARAA